MGMIDAKRWSYASAGILAGAIYVVFGLENGVFFSALAWIIELEVKRARVALWPECDNAMRWIMGEHGFEYDASPQIYNKEP
jgi:hypothetical protein